jgi:hypothetical protein
VIEDDSSPQFVQRHFQNYTGWFKSWRQVLNNALWSTCPHSWFRVFFAILACARYDKQEVRIGGETVIAPPGSLTIGTHEFALFCGISRQQLRSALDYLVVENVITTTTTPRFTLVTICNWEAYQCESSADPKDGNQANNQPNNHPDNQLNNQRVTTPVTTSKEVKNKRKNTTVQLALKDHPLVVDLAERMHSRHPAPRRCTPSEVKVQIAAILKSRPESEWSALCAQIDQNHVTACGQLSWQKDGGEFAKSLVNWLAPTMGRWETPVTPVANSQSATPQPKRLLTTELYRD